MMNIHFNTDNHIKGSDNFSQRFRDEMESKLSRFEEYVTRYNVHFGDENNSKKAINDKRCMIEARLKGKAPVAVTHNADTLDHAFNGAMDKLLNLLDSEVGKQQVIR